mgnify:FL=1
MTDPKDGAMNLTHAHKPSSQMADGAQTDVDKASRVHMLLIAEAEKGLDDILAGSTRPARNVVQRLRQGKWARQKGIEGIKF